MHLTGEFVVYCCKCNKQLKTRVDYKLGRSKKNILHLRLDLLDKHLQHGWKRIRTKGGDSEVICPFCAPAENFASNAQETGKADFSPGVKKAQKKILKGCYPPGVPNSEKLSG